MVKIDNVISRGEALVRVRGFATRSRRALADVAVDIVAGALTLPDASTGERP